jgi:hypothetical protein
MERAKLFGHPIHQMLGGELVDRLAVGVEPGAHVDAPSSLKSRRAA